MPRSIVNSDNLKIFSNELKNYEDEIRQIVRSVENELNSFKWADGVGSNFHNSFNSWKTNAEKNVFSLLRNSYEHLDKLAKSVDEYNE